jgi:hypothetical protein
MNATDDRRIELEERRRNTYQGHALDDELDLGGRFARVRTSTVVGVGQISYPAQPSGPWSKDECPPEPFIDGTGEGTRLGYRIDGGPEPESSSTALGGESAGPTQVAPSVRSGARFKRRF